MKGKDFVYLNIPSLLDQKVWIKLPNEEGGPILDTEWSARNEGQIRSLVKFFRDNGLLNDGIVVENSDIVKLALRFSDFTEEGQKFIMSSAPEKWNASFDRNPVKSVLDTSYLAKKLKSLRSAK